MIIAEQKDVVADALSIENSPPDIEEISQWHKKHTKKQANQR
jgi:hypothetical protein